MKRCPACGRDYNDDSLSFCLDDGSELLFGPGEGSASDEPKTAILHETSSAEAATRPRIPTTAAETEPRSPSGDQSGKQSVTADKGAKPRANAKVFVSVALVLVLALGGYFGYRSFYAAGQQISSIAVMPFVNDSGNPEVEYLSDGMTEALIGSLSQLPGLNVKARSTVFRYKGRDADAKTIASELGVQAVLNGRVKQWGDKLTLSLELIDAHTENVIWSDKYDRQSTDLVNLQSEIARDVSNKLKLKLTGVDQQKLAKSYTKDAEAYRLYLQGRFYWNKRTGSEVQKAIPFFQQAVARDPNFALGYVGLADSDEDRDRPLKKQYIQRALEIDPDLAEAHASLGYQYMLDYNWAESERELRRAQELNPKYPQAYAWNGARLMMIGKYDESLAQIDNALELDPASNGINFYKGVCLGVAGRYDESIRQLKKIIEMDPRFPWAHSHIARIYRILGDTRQAAEERAISLELDGRPEMAAGVRQAFANGGWDAVERYLVDNSPPDAFYNGIVSGEEKEKWIAKLTRQAEQGNFWLFLIKTEPRFEPLRGDPRFEALVHKFDVPA
jgi:TolB-like protein/Tfp pilus assembly protein PilF